MSCRYYLNGEAGARLSDAELEQSLHLVAVVEHGAVDHPFVVVGKVFQVLVVRGDDAKRLFLPELFQHCLGNGAADGRLGAAAELVDEQQAAVIRLSHHLFHVHQV